MRAFHLTRIMVCVACCLGSENSCLIYFAPWLCQCTAPGGLTSCRSTAFVGFDIVTVSRWAEAEVARQWLPNLSPCLPTTSWQPPDPLRQPGRLDICFNHFTQGCVSWLDSVDRNSFRWALLSTVGNSAWNRGRTSVSVSESCSRCGNA